MTTFPLKSLLLIGCSCLFLLSGWNGVPSSGKVMEKGRKYYEARGEIVWEVPTEEKVIALTFDDGPDAVETPEILDVLKEHGAKATFFILGKRAERHPEIVLRQAVEGHELANHTYNHAYYRKKNSADEIRREIVKAEEVIVSITGQKPYLFRPPGGYYNEEVVKASRDAGYTVVLWSWHQNTDDWKLPGVGKIVDKVLTNARGGDIILFHDHVNGRSQTAEALRRILPALKERGFQFVTVSELLRRRNMQPVRTADHAPPLPERPQPENAGR